MSCHTTKETTTDDVRLRNFKLQQTTNQDFTLGLWDICRLDILDSTGKTTGSIVQKRHTKAKINTADTTQIKTNDTIKNQQTKATNRNVSAVPDVSEGWYHVIVFVCACIVMVAVFRISRI